MEQLSIPGTPGNGKTGAIKAKRKSPESVRRLSPKEVFLLATLVAAEYVSSGDNDARFALYASEKLGIPGINRNHIATSREIHGIPSSRFAELAAAPASREQEFADRILSLEKQVRKLFAQTSTAEPSSQHEEPTQDQAYALWMKIYNERPASSGEARAYVFALSILRGNWK